MSDILQKLNALARTAAPLEGQNKTGLEDLNVYRFSQKAVTMPGTGLPCIYTVLDGTLRLKAPDGLSDYAPGRYHVFTNGTPIMGSVGTFSEEHDLLTLSVKLTPNEVFSVLSELEEPLIRAIREDRLPAGAENMTDESVLEDVLGLVQAADDPLRRGFLGRNLKRRLIFHVLCGSGGRRLLQGIVHIQQDGKMFELNNWIEQNYRSDFTVEGLAQRWNISVPALHQKFKSCVGMGLLQRQKRLRLTEARRLMLDEGWNVTQAAMDVGYESLSQFIREYKRLYGASPKEDVMRLRKLAT